MILYTMEINALIKFLIAIFLTCPHNDTKVCANPSKVRSNLVCRIKNPRHWEGMWFKEFFYKNDWKPLRRLWKLNNRVRVEDRLQMATTMMGCAYGSNLNRFLLLTLEAIDECDKMQRSNKDHADGCRDELRVSIEKGKVFIRKLFYTYGYIKSDCHINVNDNQFYRILMSLQDFAIGHLPVEYSSIIPGGLLVNELFNEAADGLKGFLFFTCFPEPKLFNLTETKSEYNGDPNAIYSFYIVKLNSYIDNNDNHLSQLGFHYDVSTDQITFDPGQRE